MDYQGIIIEESLIDCSILEELKILNQEVEYITEKEGTPWLDRWTLDTVLISSDRIEEYTFRLSKLIDVEHCGDWYCDFKNNQYHYIVFHDKIFCLDRKRKEDYEVMRAYALQLGLPEHQLPEYEG